MSIIAGALIALVFVLGVALIDWLSNRPEPSDSTTQEIRDELRDTFRQKDELEFLTIVEHLDPILDILASQFSKGFRCRHLEMLRFRIETQPPDEIRSASYPVRWKGDESDLEIQWISSVDDRIHVRICGPGGSLEPIRDAVEQSPARICSESLTSVGL